MPQSLLLKGVKDVVNYTTTDGTFPLRLKQNLRGGSTFQIKQWWDKKGNNTVYNSCTVFEIVGSDNYIVIPTSSSTQLGIGYDDDIYNITFSNYSQVDRVAVFNTHDLLICEYLFPSVSGGTIAKRTLVPAKFIGDVTVTGTRTPVAGVANAYSAAISGTATDQTYIWSTTDGSATLTNATSATPTITYSTADTYTTTCKVTSSAATDSPATETINVTCTAPITIGTATVSGPTAVYTGAPTTYSVATSGNAVDETYAWETSDSGATITKGTAVNAEISFLNAGNHTVKCVVSSATATPGSVDSADLAVAATVQVVLGTVSIIGPATGGEDEELSFTANYSGNALEGDASYNWTIAPETAGAIATPGAKTTKVTLTDADIYTLSCMISASTADDSPKTATKNITIS